MSCGLKKPSWSDEECKQYGAASTASEAKCGMEQMRGEQGEALTRAIMKDMRSKGLLTSERQKTMLVEETPLMPRSAAAQLLRSVPSGDFRDILVLTIKIPTLCIGGSQSHLPPKCMEWASQQMPKDGYLPVAGGVAFHVFGISGGIQSSCRRLSKKALCTQQLQPLKPFLVAQESGLREDYFHETSWIGSM
jgi:hypothetical protein